MTITFNAGLSTANDTVGHNPADYIVRVFDTDTGVFDTDWTTWSTNTLFGGYWTTDPLPAAFTPPGADWEVVQTLSLGGTRLTVQVRLLTGLDGGPGWPQNINFGVGSEPDDINAHLLTLQVGGFAGSGFNTFDGPRFTTGYVPIEITTLTLPDGEVSVAYNEDITAQYGSETDYAWSVVAGTLPPGLTLAASGTPTTTLSGTPSTPGTYTFTVEVEDDVGNTDQQEYTIEITGVAVVVPTVILVPASSASLDGGEKLSIISTEGAFHDIGAQMLVTELTASQPASWDFDAAWTYLRRRGLVGLAIAGGSSVRNEVSIHTSVDGLVRAGEASIDITEWNTTDTDSDFGLEWITGSATLRLVLRPSTSTLGNVVLEVESASVRRIINSTTITKLPTQITPSTLRLVYVDGHAFGYVDAELVGRGSCTPSSSVSTLSVVATARTNGAVVSGRVNQVCTKAAVLIDGNLAEVVSPNTATRALSVTIPRGRNIARIGQRHITVAGFFGETTVTNGFSYTNPVRNILGRNALIRRR